MADEVVEPAGGEEEADAAPAAAPDTDVSDLPIDESPEAHIRRAMAGEDAGGGEAEPAGDAEEAGDGEPAGDAEEASGAEEAGDAAEGGG